MRQAGKAIIFGIRPMKAIINIPKEAVGIRIELSERHYAKAEIYLKDRIETWIIVPTGNILNAETWELGILQDTKLL